MLGLKECAIIYKSLKKLFKALQVVLSVVPDYMTITISLSTLDFKHKFNSQLGDLHFLTA